LLPVRQQGTVAMSEKRRKAITTLKVRGDSLNKQNKEWAGNTKSVFSTIGSTAHGTQIRVAGDFYATDPRAVDALEYSDKLPKNVKIWECAAGQGDLSEALISRGYDVISTDLYNRGY
jgi:hypothetical protein